MSSSLLDCSTPPPPPLPTAAATTTTTTSRIIIVTNVGNSEATTAKSQQQQQQEMQLQPQPQPAAQNQSRVHRSNNNSSNKHNIPFKSSLSPPSASLPSSPGPAPWPLWLCRRRPPKLFGWLRPCPLAASGVWTTLWVEDIAVRESLGKDSGCARELGGIAWGDTDALAMSALECDCLAAHKHCDSEACRQFLSHGPSQPITLPPHLPPMSFHVYDLAQQKGFRAWPPQRGTGRGRERVGLICIISLISVRIIEVPVLDETSVSIRRSAASQLL